MKKLINACFLFYRLLKKAEEFPISRRVSRAIAAYEQFFKLKLIPGPSGSVGQIFFLQEKPGIVVKFTTDSSEAKNMMLVYNIQSDKVVPAGMTQREIDIIKNGIIKVFNVFAFEYGRGRIYVIEQERGKDLPMSLSKKLLETIGSNISKQPDEVFKIIQTQLSEPSKINELSKILANHLTEQGQLTIEQTPEVDAGNLGLLLKVVRDRIDSSFKDFRPSNMVVAKNGNKYIIKLIDLGYGSNSDIEIPTVSI